MWAPRAWSEVAALIGSAEETSTLDFKQQLGSNPETAKDIAAMTVDGGVLVYGLEEDKNTRLAKAIHKFPLKGIEEKLRQVMGTRISPGPEVELLLLTQQDGDPDGIVVAVVPPSPLAPHMVDGRYPCRRGTTTANLSEAEVRRLYERRSDLAGPPRTADEVLAEFRPPPAPADANQTPGGVGRVRLAVVPVSSGAAHSAAPWLQEALRRAHDATVAALLPRLKYGTGPKELERLQTWEPYGTVGWSSGIAVAGEQALNRTSSAGVLTYPAELSFQATWPLTVPEQGGASGYRSAYEAEVGLAVVIFCAYAGQFLSEIDGVGSVNCAIQLAGYEGARSQSATRGIAGAYAHLPGAHDHSGATVTTALDLRDEPDRVAARLMDPWLVPFYEMPQPLWDVLLHPPNAPTP